MTDTPVPDVRELAAAAVTSAGRCDHPGAETCDPWWIADAVLAAVTPVIRRQERADIAEDLDAEAARVRAEEWPVKVGAEYVYGIEHAAAFVENMAPRSHSHPTHRGGDVSRHRTTDPACRKHRAPRTPLGRWWFDRNRGRSCGVCVKPATAETAEGDNHG